LQRPSGAYRRAIVLILYTSISIHVIHIVDNKKFFIEYILDLLEAPKIAMNQDGMERLHFAKEIPLELKPTTSSLQ
jgi:hypothetical protein